MTAKFSPITGRYVHVTVQGVEYRVYFEEAGKGTPVLMQHTAGTDGRQWRHILEDEKLTSQFRFVAHDLPYHGRSLPPLAMSPLSASSLVHITNGVELVARPRSASVI